MLYKRILVPFDGSEHAFGALEAACELMRDGQDSQMRIVTIVPAPAVNTDNATKRSGTVRPPVALMDMNDYAEVITQAVEAERANLIDKVGDIIAEFGDRAQVDAIPNLSAIEGITTYVKENGVDLIVMGRRGLSPLRGVLGSVSYGILRSADVPVLTVK